MFWRLERQAALSVPLTSTAPGDILRPMRKDANLWLRLASESENTPILNLGGDQHLVVWDLNVQSVLHMLCVAKGENLHLEVDPDSAAGSNDGQLGSLVICDNGPYLQARMGDTFHQDCFVSLLDWRIAGYDAVSQARGHFKKWRLVEHRKPGESHTWIDLGV